MGLRLQARSTSADILSSAFNGRGCPALVLADSESSKSQERFVRVGGCRRGGHRGVDRARNLGRWALYFDSSTTQLRRGDAVSESGLTPEEGSPRALFFAHPSGPGDFSFPNGKGRPSSSPSRQS